LGFFVSSSKRVETIRDDSPRGLEGRKVDISPEFPRVLCALAVNSFFVRKPSLGLRW
jgi:hypothetical protein